MIDTNGIAYTEFFLPSHCTSVIFLNYLRVCMQQCSNTTKCTFFSDRSYRYKTRLEKLDSRKPGSLNEWVLLSCRSTKVVSLAITTPFFFSRAQLLLLLAQFSGQVIFLRSTEKSSTLVALERGAAITFWKASFTGRTIDRDHPMSS